MLPQHNSRTVAQRIDIQAMRQPSRLRRLRWQLGWAGMALALVIPLAALVRGDKTIYQSGAVSAAHQFIANDCRRCHDRPGQTAVRAVSFNRAASSVSDQACLACHAGPPHHAASLAARRCAECHREHEGPRALSRVPTAFCTECHADLPSTASFTRAIPDFASHPEFAVMRNASDATIGSSHKLRRLAEPQGDRWRDKAAIVLNHKAHMNPRGIASPSGTAGELASQATRLNAPTPTSVPLERLECQSCHQPDAASGNFQPISFEQHCRRCHEDQLSFAGAQASPLRDVQPLPHREPEIVRGALRERLSRALTAGQAPDELKDQPLRRFFPGVPDPKPLSESQTETLAQQLRLAEGLLFAPKTTSTHAGAGLAYCHEVSRSCEQVTITPPAIPSQWLPHSRYRHDAHRQLACVACHESATASTATADVLLPSIDSCRKCHQAEAPAARHSGEPASARADCSQCHDYHIHASHSWDGTHAVP